MAIRYQPKKILKRFAMKRKDMERLVNKNLTLNRAAVQTLQATGVLTKKTLEKTALQVIKGYKKRYKEEIKEKSKSEALEDTLNDKKLLVQRIENDAIQAIATEIKVQYRGEFYEWLPSDAEEPDPEHQLKYGMKFQIGKGEMPGDRYGCKCGMNILVEETKLNL